MAELDNLLGSRISLITQLDIRYEGVLFSINQNESSIVLRDVRYFGTEDRPAAKKMAATSEVLAFVSFPGSEIKDLYVHEGDEDAPTDEKEKKLEHEQEKESPPTPPAAAPASAVSSGPPAVPQSTKPPTKSAPKQQPHQQRQQQQKLKQQQQQPRNNNSNNNNTQGKKNSTVGTGAHLLHLREKTVSSEVGSVQKAEGEFDFEGGLTSFKKEEVLAEVASEQSGVVAGDSCYKKDNFFDMLSSNSLDEQTGVRRERMTAGQERHLNQDTFGAIALQQNNRSRYGYSGRGRGRGGGRGGRGGNYNSRHHNKQGQGQGQRNPVAAK